MMYGNVSFSDAVVGKRKSRIAAEVSKPSILKKMLDFKQK